MYPYDARWKWWVRGRPRHLVDAIEAQPGLLTGKRGIVIQDRLDRIGVWLKVRLAVLIFLSFALVASLASLVLSWFPGTALAEDALRLFVRIATTSTGLLTALYFLTTRTLGQLEIDVLLLIHPEVRQ